ncbi:aldo/keto reductase [Aquimarina megaterium]|uniref:aldo/keto reductase n=1 Tax=Aquimarina megaterium TaxID=1443666 RepID=UPI0004720F31|nr:aldo/keto reductase [Aquimarina megaterium]
MRVNKLRDLKVSEIGYGCMSLSMGYGATPSKKEAISIIQSVYNQGCTFFDTAEIYGNGENEKLVGEALKNVRNKVVIATKFMLQIPGENLTRDKLMIIIREKLEASLKNLGMDYIDLYYQHRVNKDIPVEDVAWCMGKFIEEGKIHGWGQSNSTVEEIRNAHAVTPITAIQSEYSMLSRHFEEDIIPTCKELGIGFVAYSPLASGFLSGKINLDTEYVGFDARRVIPRFEKENIIANQPLIDLLSKFADKKNATPAQISLAWMLHKNDFVVPIPSSRKEQRNIENFGAVDIILTENEFTQIENELSKIKIHGKKTTDEDMFKLAALVS